MTPQILDFAGEFYILANVSSNILDLSNKEWFFHQFSGVCLIANNGYMISLLAKLEIQVWLTPCYLCGAIDSCRWIISGCHYFSSVETNGTIGSSDWEIFWEDTTMYYRLGAIKQMLLRPTWQTHDIGAPTGLSPTIRNVLPSIGNFIWTIVIIDGVYFATAISSVIGRRN